MDEDFVSLGRSVAESHKARGANLKLRLADTIAVTRNERISRIDGRAYGYWRMRINKGAWVALGEPEVVDVLSDKATNQIKVVPGTTFTLVPAKKGTSSFVIPGGGLKEMPVGVYKSIGNNVYEYAPEKNKLPVDQL